MGKPPALGQRQIGEGKLIVSGVIPGTTGAAPIVIGKIHDQQISVIGLTGRPVQALALAGTALIKK